MGLKPASTPEVLDNFVGAGNSRDSWCWEALKGSGLQYWMPGTLCSRETSAGNISQSVWSAIVRII